MLHDEVISPYITRPVSTAALLTDPESPLYQPGEFEKGFQVRDLKTAYNRSEKVSLGQAFTKSDLTPIKDVADIVFDNVLSCIKDEKETLEEDDYGRKSELNNKELQANMSMMYIKCFDDPDHNSDFTNELSILNQIR